MSGSSKYLIRTGAAWAAVVCCGWFAGRWARELNTSRSMGLGTMDIVTGDVNKDGVSNYTNRVHRNRGSESDNSKKAPKADWDPWSRDITYVPPSLFKYRHFPVMTKLSGDYGLDDAVLVQLGVTNDTLPAVHAGFNKMLTALKAAEISNRQVLASDGSSVEFEIGNYDKERLNAVEGFAADIEPAVGGVKSKLLKAMISQTLSREHGFGLARRWLKITVNEDQSLQIQTALGIPGTEAYLPPLTYTTFAEIPPEFRHLATEADVPDAEGSASSSQ